MAENKRKCIITDKTIHTKKFTEAGNGLCSEVVSVTNSHSERRDFRKTHSENAEGIAILAKQDHRPETKESNGSAVKRNKSSIDVEEKTAKRQKTSLFQSFLNYNAEGIAILAKQNEEIKGRRTDGGKRKEEEDVEEPVFKRRNIDQQKLAEQFSEKKNPPRDDNRSSRKGDKARQADKARKDKE